MQINLTLSISFETVKFNLGNKVQLVPPNGPSAQTENSFLSYVIYQQQTFITKHIVLFYKSHEAKQCTLAQQSEESSLQSFVEYPFLSHSSVVHFFWTVYINQNEHVYHVAFPIHFLV